MISKNSIENVKLANWNADGIREKRGVTIDFLSRNNVDIMCISETHLVVNEKLKIPGYKIYRSDRHAPIASGGVAILIKNKFKHYEFQLPKLVHLESVAIVVEYRNNQKLKIIAAYQQPNKRIREEDFTALFDNNSTILCGDLNSKHIEWGCRSNNPNGTKLMSVITNHAIQISAPDEPTHIPYRPDHLPDILDVVLHRNFCSPIHQEVLCELDSDHLPVLITFSSVLQKNQRIDKLIKGPIDWKTFQAELNRNLLPICQFNLDETESIDEAVENYKSSIYRAINSSTTDEPGSRYTYTTRIPNYISTLIKQKHRTRRLWQNTRDRNVKTELNRLTHKINWELQHYAISNYQKYISDIEANDNSLWKATKNILRQTNVIPPITTDEGVFCSDEEKSNIFADHFESAFKNDTNIEEDLEFQYSIDQNLQEQILETEAEQMDPVTHGEIKWYIKELKNKKAPGYDRITNEILKKLTSKAIAYLCAIFNACLRTGHFPSKWKHAEIIVIPKPGKNKRIVSSYRPISLLPTLSKLLEKVIQRRLQADIDEGNKIPAFQFGFKKHHSTTQQLLRLTEAIVKGFEEKSHTVIAFLDAAQAFDKVWHNGLLYKLKSKNFPTYIYNIIQSFINNRTFQVKINNSKSSYRTIKSGVPQGSILGPLLFNIYVSDLPTPQDTQVSMYADDTSVFTQHQDIVIARNRLQSSLNIISTWMRQWKIRLNPNKCETKIFTLRRPPNPPYIVINSRPIEWNPHNGNIRYLGVLLDRRLTWTQHINQKLKEANTRLRLLYPILNKNSPLKTKCGLLLYTSILRPLITYACQIWGVASDTQMEKIQRFQNRMLRLIAKAPWFLRNRQIHYELGILTIKEYVKKTTKHFFENMEFSASANYYQLGQRSRHTRLKKRLPQDLLLSSEDSDNDNL